jgi:glucose/arabinose dehydrogenase
MDFLPNIKPMHRFSELLLVLLIVLICAPAGTQPLLDLPVYASGFTQPVDIASAGDGRLFVVEQAGRIRIIGADGAPLSQPFLDIRSRVGSEGNEQGLLGLVFHPDYADNGFFYVNYTNTSGDTRIARFSVRSDDPDRADPESEKILLSVDQPYANHNAGDLNFGPDGFLYFGLGDGGSGGDPKENGQGRQTLLGKMLRIDIDNGDPYSIPEGNPFSMTDETLDEVWAIGLRNPWRFSFDRETGDLWIADVGQNQIEEINFQQADSGGGENYGWDCYEGNQVYEQTDCPALSELTFPLHTYPHQDGNRSVTGGFVYRGSEFPNLEGIYIYADYVSGRIWGLLPDPESGYVNTLLLDFNNGEISSFGEDENGELYIAGRSSGNIYRVIDQCATLEIPMIGFENDILSVPDTFDAYQWFRDGEPIPGATAAEYVPSETGAFTLEVADDRGCSATAESFLVTSAAPAIGIRWWQVTPNPFREEIRLEVEVVQPAAFLVKIYDGQGRLVLRDQLERASNWSRRYPLKELESGLYFLSLERGQQRVVQKLLKSN